jgi:hypothetical protein
MQEINLTHIEPKMKNSSCPACGKVNPQEMRQCPKLKGEAVCVHCCENCDTYDAGTFRCTWHAVNKTIIIDEEVKRLRNKIAFLEKEVKRKYRSNQPKRGNMLLNEEKSCISQLKKLERLREQGFRYI